MYITDQLLMTAQAVVSGISKPELDEFFNIAQHMPVFPGHTMSHHTAKNLVNRALAMKYDGNYVLTEEGKRTIKQIAASATPPIELTAVWAKTYPES